MKRVSRPSRSPRFTRAILRSGSSTKTAPRCPSSHVSGVIQGSRTSTPPASRWFAMDVTARSRFCTVLYVANAAEKAHDGVEPAPQIEVHHVAFVQRDVGETFRCDRK